MRTQVNLIRSVDEDAGTVTEYYEVMAEGEFGWIRVGVLPTRDLADEYASTF